MGKNSKAQEAEARRQYMEARRREEEEKQRRQNRLMWQIVIITVAAVVVIATLGIVIPMLLEGNENGISDVETESQEPAVPMDDLDFSSIVFDKYADTENVTNLVRLNVSYTDSNGLFQTGDIVIRLFEEVAPETVKNFQTLVSQGFYDGLTFHRIVPGFMIQGGDPKGNGSGDSGKTIQGEFTKNGFENNLSHIRGVVSMARGNSYNSASCQFFIVHNDSAARSLNGLYASFGYVVYGMSTVDGITGTKLEYASGSTDSSPSSPVRDVTINSATFLTPNTTD